MESDSAIGYFGESSDNFSDHAFFTLVNKINEIPGNPSFFNHGQNMVRIIYFSRGFRSWVCYAHSSLTNLPFEVHMLDLPLREGPHRLLFVPLFAERLRQVGDDLVLALDRGLVRMEELLHSLDLVLKVSPLRGRTIKNKKNL